MSEIREIVRRQNLNELIRRVAGASIEEIDRIILELQDVRDMLRNEGERVSRNLAGYASLNHASMTAMKVVGDNLKQWKDGQRRPSVSSRDGRSITMLPSTVSNLGSKFNVASLKGEGPRQPQEKETALSLKMNHHPRTDNA